MIRFKKKSLVSIILAASMLLSLTGCKKEKDIDDSNETTIASDTENEITTEDDGNKDATENADTTPSGEVYELSVYAQDAPDTDEALSEQEKFDVYLDDSFKESVVCDTITLHYTLADPEGYGVTPPEVTYGDAGITDEIIEEDKKEIEDDLAELREFDYDLLTGEQKYTYDILENELENNLEFYDYIYLYEPFAYTSGLQSNIPITLSEYTFRNTKDVEDYIQLLVLLRDYVDVYLDFEDVKSEKGLFMNSNSANEVIRQCNEFIATPEENLLIETFNARIGDVPGITEEEIESYKQQNYDAVMNSVIPAYEDIIKKFKALKATGTNELGLAHYENGTDYYAYLIKSKVGSDKTPEEVIEVLDNAIADTMEEYQTLALANYNDYTAYFEDMENLYGDLDPEETIRYFEKETTDLFPEIPSINFTVSPVHSSLENIVSPAFFMTPPLDDYEHNTIHTNLGSDGAGNIWSTLAHEGIPGHMYQFVYFLSSNPEPIRTILNFSGYQEGWASYTELMSYSYYDGYKAECYGDFERINSCINLLVSARVEIGVNYEGWNLEDTENYLSANGFSAEAAQGIMDYVIAEPGNYQMYVLGWQEIVLLRDKAMDALGDSFDEKEFHKAFLDAGPSQFFLVEERINDYIAMNH